MCHISATISQQHFIHNINHSYGAKSNVLVISLLRRTEMWGVRSMEKRKRVLKCIRHWLTAYWPDILLHQKHLQMHNRAHILEIWYYSDIYIRWNVALRLLPIISPFNIKGRILWRMSKTRDELYSFSDFIEISEFTVQHNQLSRAHLSRPIPRWLNDYL